MAIFILVFSSHCDISSFLDDCSQEEIEAFLQGSDEESEADELDKPDGHVYSNKDNIDTNCDVLEEEFDGMIFDTSFLNLLYSVN